LISHYSPAKRASVHTHQ